MKIVLDLKINREPKENDLIVYKNGQWCVLSKESFLAKTEGKQMLKNQEFEKRIEKLQKDLISLAKIVKEKSK